MSRSFKELKIDAERVCKDHRPTGGIGALARIVAELLLVVIKQSSEIEKLKEAIVRLEDK